MANPDDTLIIETSQGPVVVAMRPDLAPKHVARIKELARQGFYDGVVFHRVIDGFMAQTGDPTGTGMSGSGQKLRAEFNAEPHTRGAVSMARAQSPDSADSQFFICLRRLEIPRQAIHGVGPRHRGHGECGQAQTRRAAHPPPQKTLPPTPPQTQKKEKMPPRPPPPFPPPPPPAGAPLSPAPHPHHPFAPPPPPPPPPPTPLFLLMGGGEPPSTPPTRCSPGQASPP